MRYEDHRVCDTGCRAAAAPSPYVRDRPPALACPHCGARPGVACVVRSHPRLKLERFGRFHASRMEAA